MFERNLIKNFITSGTVEVGDFLYTDKRTNGKLRSISKLKRRPTLIIGRAISEIDKNLWAVQIKSEE